MEFILRPSKIYDLKLAQVWGHLPFLFLGLFALPPLSRREFNRYYSSAIHNWIWTVRTATYTQSFLRGEVLDELQRALYIFVFSRLLGVTIRTSLL
jgi:hypothetical protein